MEVEKPTPQENTPVTLTLSHDAAVALGAAAIHCRAWFAVNPEMAPTIKHLDEVVALIIQQPLPAPAQEMLRDMRDVLVTLEDVERGGVHHVAARSPQGCR